jgi:hypothetical protein
MLPGRSPLSYPPAVHLKSAVLGFLAAALLVVGALLPEFTTGGTGVAQIDPGREAWIPALVGMLVQVGLVLSGALMLALGESRQLAGGLLLGTGVLGLSLRVVRLFQLSAATGFNAAVGSGIDLLAETLTVAAGILALRAGREEEPDEELEDEDEADSVDSLAPPPGESL